MGGSPGLKEFGTPAFAGHADVIDFDVDHAWQRYVSTIDAVRSPWCGGAGDSGGPNAFGAPGTP